MYKNPEKYGLIGWRKVKKTAKGFGTVLFGVLIALAILAAIAIPYFVIGHFVVKYW